MASYKEHQEWVEKELAFLDTLPLENFIKNEKDVRKIMDEIEETYFKNYPYQEQKFIFNHTSEDEFIDYLRERFNIICYEQIINKILC